jgi:hypothetical protein
MLYLKLVAGFPLALSGEDKPALRCLVEHRQPPAGRWRAGEEGGAAGGDRRGLPRPEPWRPRLRGHPRQDEAGPRPSPQAARAGADGGTGPHGRRECPRRA